jgi:hypothetical protein
MCHINLLFEYVELKFDCGNIFNIRINLQKKAFQLIITIHFQRFLIDGKKSCADC